MIIHCCGGYKEMAATDQLKIEAKCELMEILKGRYFQQLTTNV